MFVRSWNRLRSEGPRATARAIARRVRKLAYLREEHVWDTTLVAKIEAANTASKRVAEKAGFEPVAVMQHEQTGVRRSTAVQVLGAGLGDELAARLS